MTGFAQLIEWKTSRYDEVEKLNEEWRERFPTTGPTRILVCSDRDNAGSTSPWWSSPPTRRR